jgi:GNAT superfamily N-acetyltransferase
MSEQTLRQAMVEDAPLLARHRCLMFKTLGLSDAQEAAALERAVEDYLRDAMPEGEYAGWIVEEGGAAVASGGVLIRDLVPRPGFFHGEREALILSMWTEPTHRRRGLGQRVLAAMLAWCAEQGARRIVLHASDDGRPLYELFGFRPTNEMRLDLPRSTT